MMTDSFLADLQYTSPLIRIQDKGPLSGSQMDKICNLITCCADFDTCSHLLGAQANGCSINGFRFDNCVAKHIASFLGSGVLRVLSITNCSLGDEGAKRIATALTNCKSLVTLNLSKNGISDVGCRALARALQFCPEISAILLPSNKITDRGFRSLATIIPSCPKLYDIMVKGNPTNDIYLADHVKTALNRVITP